MALHILCLTWNVERHDLKPLFLILKKITMAFPNNRFLIAANTEFSAYRFSAARLPSMLFPNSIFQDENVFVPVSEEVKGLPRSDALAIAHFGHFKRHDLCSKLKKPLFVYSHNPEGMLEDDMARVKGLCPDAIFVNHLLGNNEYERLDGPTIANVASHAKVGLCLSEEEGHMRASIQMLMCGLPIVTVPCIGGRERYYDDVISCEVEPTPEGVCQGVKELVNRKLTPLEVRSRVLDKVQMDRKNCLQSLNKLLRNNFKKVAPQLEFENFRGFEFIYLKESEVVSMLMES